MMMMMMNPSMLNVHEIEHIGLRTWIFNHLDFLYSIINVTLSYGNKNNGFVHYFQVVFARRTGGRVLVTGIWDPPLELDLASLGGIG